MVCLVLRCTLNGFIQGGQLCTCPLHRSEYSGNGSVKSPGPSWGGAAGRPKGLHSASSSAERQELWGKDPAALRAHPYPTQGITSPEQLLGSCGEGELPLFRGPWAVQWAAGGAERRRRASPREQGRAQWTWQGWSGGKGFGVRRSCVGLFLAILLISTMVSLRLSFVTCSRGNNACLMERL